MGTRSQQIRPTAPSGLVEVLSCTAAGGVAAGREGQFVSDRVITPHEQVTGVLDRPDDVPAAAHALQTAGFSEAAVVFVGGDEALALVDPEGRKHGLLGRLTRSLEHFGHEGEEHHAAAAAVQAGHCLVVVSVAGEAEKNLAASTLREQGVRRLRYWGRWAIEALTP
jgi:hypothetical protein